MSDRRLIGNLHGVKTFMEIDGDKTHIHKTADVEHHLNVNKKLANLNGKKIGSDAYNHVASIPPILISKWLHEEGLDIFNPDHAERLKAKLNSIEYRHLRTNELVL